MKTRSVGAEMFHADGRTDIHEADSRFSQFHERSENELQLTTGRGEGLRTGWLTPMTVST